jgi:hypothetical protein
MEQGAERQERHCGQNRHLFQEQEERGRSV